MTNFGSGLMNGGRSAAARGYLDAVIEPHQTRARFIAGLRLLGSKREKNPLRKHGNLPL
ncbi:MAG: hypothetical protein FJ102_23715 [Deltaproteobacteria bacterium]|nr:hypothetical protein [Deltaproteobacteria bacterium]